MITLSVVWLQLTNLFKYIHFFIVAPTWFYNLCITLEGKPIKASVSFFCDKIGKRCHNVNS